MEMGFTPPPGWGSPPLVRTNPHYFLWTVRSGDGAYGGLEKIRAFEWDWLKSEVFRPGSAYKPSAER